MSKRCLVLNKFQEKIGSYNSRENNAQGLNNPWRDFKRELDISQLKIFVLELKNSN